MPRFRERSSSWAVYAGRVFAIAFLLNGVWEVAQLPAFEGVLDIPISDHVLYTLLATVGDGLLIVGVYFVLSWWSSSPGWIEDARAPGYVYATVIGVASAVGIEWFAVSRGWWSYSPNMPLLAATGVGLLPFLQLTLLTPVSLWLVGTRWKVHG